MGVDFQLISEATECTICGLNKRLEKDHVNPRAQAPELINDPANQWIICAECHRKKTDNVWNIIAYEETPEEDARVEVVEVDSGRVVWRRVIPPQGFDSSTYLNSFNQLEAGLTNLEQGIRYLTNEQLVAAFELAGIISGFTWKLQAALLWEARQRMNWGAVGDTLLALARTFGIKRARVYDYLKIYEKFHDSPLWRELDVAAEAYLVAANTADPEGALNAYMDNKALDPRYTTQTFKLETLDKWKKPRLPVCPNCGNECQCKWCDYYVWPHPSHRNLPPNSPLLAPPAIAAPTGVDKPPENDLPF